MNREQREGYEQGPLRPSRLSVPNLEGRGNLLLGLYAEPLRGYKGHSILVMSEATTDIPFLFAYFAPFAVKFQRTLRYFSDPSEHFLVGGWADFVPGSEKGKGQTLNPS